MVTSVKVRLTENLPALVVEGVKAKGSLISL